MVSKNLLLWGVILFFVVSSAGEELVISPEQISISRLANEPVEETLEVTNQGSTNVFLRVVGISGGITEALPSLDKVWVRLPPGDKNYLQVKGYVNKDTPSGTYEGEIILKSEVESYEVPITLQVGKTVEEVSLSLEIAPLKSEVKPGDVLEVKYTIKNLAKKEVDVRLELSLADMDSEESVIKRELNFTILTSIEEIIELKIPDNITEKIHELRGSLLVKEGGVEKEKAADASRVVVKEPISSFFAPFTRGFTLANIMFILFMILLLVMGYISYRYYQQEKWGKKRYLESVIKSINLPSLPKPGKRSGFVGKVAGTTYKAYLNLDHLKNHVLLAGATGTGKTVAAQVIVEEALMKGAAVIVFDPTAQWTGFFRENMNKGMFKLYSKFGMSKKDARGFDGSIRIITDPSVEKFTLEKYLKPGEITVFCLHKLDSSQIEPLIVETIRKVFEKTMEESPELRALLVYEEIHRILPKFGGIGEGITWLERGAREFRKWGVGLVLISQVLSDFRGEIKANIGTEIQLMTKYEGDLKRIKLKYGEDVHRCIVKAKIGESIIQNAEYNLGKPYVLRFRPLLHNHERLKDEELEKYHKYNQRIDSLRGKLEKIKKTGVDVFDTEIELNLAMDNLKKGRFGVIDLYLDGITPRVNELEERVERGDIKEEEKAVSSEWDEKKDEELGTYKKELQESIEKEEEELEKKKGELEERQEERLKREEKERDKLEEEEKQLAQQVDGKKRVLERKSQVLDLLNRYKEVREILKDEVVGKEWEKLKVQQKKLKELEELKLEQIKEEREKKEEEIDKIMKEMRAEEDRISQGLKRVGEMKEKIFEDERKIIERDKELCQEEWEMIEKIKKDIQTEIEERGELKKELQKEQEKWDQEKLKEEISKRKEEFEEVRKGKSGAEREKRRKIEEEKDKLHNKLQKVKQKWLNLLSKKKERTKKEEEIKQREEELEKKVEEKTEGISKEEFKKFKGMADQLSDHLDPSHIEEFGKSEDFEFYKKTISQKETSEEEKKRFILIVDKLLGKLPPEKIETFVKDKDKYLLYQRIVKWGES